jgi:hypothetical protein
MTSVMPQAIENTMGLQPLCALFASLIPFFRSLFSRCGMGFFDRQRKLTHLPAGNGALRRAVSIKSVT